MRITGQTMEMAVEMVTTQTVNPTFLSPVEALIQSLPEEAMLAQAMMGVDRTGLQVPTTMKVVVPTEEIPEEIVAVPPTPTQGQTPRLMLLEGQAVLPPLLTHRQVVLPAIRQAKHQIGSPNLRGPL